MLYGVDIFLLSLSLLSLPGTSGAAEIKTAIGVPFKFSTPEQICQDRMSGVPGNPLLPKGRAIYPETGCNNSQKYQIPNSRNIEKRLCNSGCSI
jgi:hypothetical protein